MRAASTIARWRGTGTADHDYAAIDANPGLEIRTLAMVPSRKRPRRYRSSGKPEGPQALRRARRKFS